MTNATRYLFVAVIFTVGLFASFAEADLVLVDANATNSITSGTRLTLGNVSNEWVAWSTTEWSVAAGELSNAGTQINNRNSEGGLLQVIEVGSGNDCTEITFSFDYSVGAGAILYFHAIGLYDGTTTAGGTHLHNTGATNGNIQAQYDDAPTAGRGDFTGMNLKNGAASPNGSSGGAVSFAAGTSGTYTQTFDISSYAGIDNISDFQYITLGFGINVTDATTGAVSIDNFEAIASSVPEPSALALLGLALGGICFRRRR